MQMNTIKYGLRLLLLTLTGVLWSATATQAVEIRYSPADSILYLEYLPAHPYLFRIRDGGARIERAAEAAPANIIAFDAIPGHLFSYDDVYPFPDYRSTDYGETWDLYETFPYSSIWLWEFSSWCGEFSGQSQIFNDSWLFFTSNSWQTYDSASLSRWSSEAQDSIDLFSLSYRIGCYYALTRQNDYLCVTSDTGRTWAVGSHSDVQYYDQTRIGAVDEMWGRYGYRIILTLDTGRTVIDPVFTAHPPLRPYAWHLNLWPTDHQGEAYVVMDLDWWTDPFTTELIVYHILNYGARVDSFYYCLYDYEIPDGASEPILPKQFSLSAYPNPFNSATQIEFMLPNTQQVSLRLYDVLGREVTVLVNEIKTAGEHRVAFDASGLASGVYLCRMEAGSYTQTRKIVLTR
jgi:hypothetical protein